MKRPTMKRPTTILRLLVPLALLLSLFPAGLAFAQDDTVPTEAQVDPAGTPPEVLYKFELPDADSGTAGIQYDSDDGAPGQPGAQIAPNLEDLPEVQQIAYWWIATDPNGIGDVIDAFVRVFHPDGSLKYQLHDPDGPNPCTDLGTWATPGTPLYAAVRSGQLTTVEADAIVENCTKNVWLAFEVVGELSKHQPAGPYTVTASVVDQAGNTSSLTNIMDVLPVVGLEIDFTGIDFGQILPNTTKWVRGDTNFQAGTMPSVKNTGNVLMYLALHFSEMVGVEFGKVINVFDAKLNTQAIDPIDASTQVCFDLEPLGSNEVGQLDTSIHPGPIPADIYHGWLDLWGLQSCAP
jgi:hypothetical protein